MGRRAACGQLHCLGGDTGHWSLGSCSRGGGGKYRQIRDSSLIAGNTSLPIVHLSYKNLMNISSIAWVGVGVKVCPCTVYDYYQQPPILACP